MSTNKLVVCAVCKREYDQGVLGPHQANSCAAGYIEQGDRKFVLGFYGSEYDTALYEFRGAVPEKWYKAHAICDLCMNEAVAEGLIEQVPGDYPWGLLEYPSGVMFEGDPVPRKIPPLPDKPQN